MKVIKGNVKLAQLLVNYLYRKYSEKGYIVRFDNKIDEYVLHIGTDETGFGGTCAGITGLDKDIIVRIKPEARSDGQYVSVNASGKYRGKAGRIGFGTFVAFGIVAITAVCGVGAQVIMARNIERDAEDFMRHQQCRALSYVHNNSRL